MRQWRRSFYSRALDWLAAGATVRLSDPGTTTEVARLPVRHCFLWSM